MEHTKSSLEYFETVLFGEQFLPLDLNLSLDLELNLSKLLLLSSKLFFLESDRLVSHVFGEDRRVAIYQLRQHAYNLRIATTDRSRELFRSVVFVQEIMSDLFEVRQVRPACQRSLCLKAWTYINRAPLNREKSEC
jgi:hypothetical protein